MAKYTYTVALPITGVVYVDVESDVELSEEDAIQKAFDIGVSSDGIEEWEVHEQIVQGNVFYGLRNDAEVIDTQIEDDE